MEQENSVLFFESQLNAICNTMSGDDMVSFMKVIYKYITSGEEEEIDPAKKPLLYAMVKMTIPSIKRHNGIAKKNKENIKKRWEKQQEQKKEASVAQPSPSVAQKEEQLVKTTSLSEKAVETANFTKIEKIKEPEKPIILEKKEPVAEEQVEDVVLSEASQDGAYIDPDDNVYTEADMVSVVDEKPVQTSAVSAVSKEQEGDEYKDGIKNMMSKFKIIDEEPVAEEQEQTSTLSQAEIDAVQKTEIEPAKMKKILNNAQAEQLNKLRKSWNSAGLPKDTISFYNATKEYQAKIIQGLNSFINELEFEYACRNYKYIISNPSLFKNYTNYKFEGFVASGYNVFTNDQDPFTRFSADGKCHKPLDMIQADIKNNIASESDKKQLENEMEAKWYNDRDYTNEICDATKMEYETFKKLPFATKVKYRDCLIKNKKEVEEEYQKVEKIILQYHRDSYEIFKKEFNEYCIKGEQRAYLDLILMYHKENLAEAKKKEKIAVAV